MKQMRKEKKIKWDFAKIKEEYFNSDYQEVKIFFEDKYNIYNPHVAKNTAGWAADKKERNMRIVNKALAEMEEKEVRDLKMGLKNARYFFLGKVSNKEKLEKLSVKDAQRVWEVIRTENNLPTRITRNTNTNTNIEVKDKLYNDLDAYDTPDHKGEIAREMEDTELGESEED